MNGTIITNKGLHLIAKLVATTAPLEFTRAAIGIGQAPSGYDPGGMLDLSDYKMDGVIYSCSATGDEASVVFQVSSIGVDTGFVATEAGLFAEDPDEGEILYAYLDLSEDPQYIYPENSAISKFVEFTLVVKIGLVSRVTAQINPSSLVSKEDFEDKMDEIENPTFDDSGEVEEISSFPDFLGSVVNKMNLFQFFRNLKAGMGYVLHMGKLVNNGLCDTPGQFALDAAYGKNLQDQLTKLNSDFGSGRKPNDTDLNTLISAGAWWVGTNSSSSNHFPEDSVNGWLQVFAYNNEIKQIFYRYGTLNYSDYYTYVRTYNSSLNQWSEWKRFLTD
ncbi:MAG: hypothetical protein HFG54_14265 [Lachnospiraceae bacterium]|nr:hypothetical protein [Lachnospiraceae bacterium]